MCGIAGMIGVSAAVVEPAVRGMMDAMQRRGPDDQGIEVFKPEHPKGGACIALGFRRLAILDLSATGHQPMVHAETGDCLVFNGEIYNFRQLRGELERSGSRFRGTSDSEVLLHALSRWGDEALLKIEGMYAFAFYRAIDRRLLLARDPLGIKPLYFATHRDGVVFASETRALLKSGVVGREIDHAGLAGLLAYGAVQGQRTLFRGLRSFPAGHSQWFSLSEQAPGLPPKRFWQFPATLNASGCENAITTVRQLVEEAVARHLVADVPVGVFLSAGIDSTVIAACAAKQNADVTAFTVGIGNDHPEDEVAVASSTARRLGIRHRVARISTQMLPGLWNDWIKSFDSPSIDGFNTFLVSKSLAEHGIKVGLSGLGADELFGGYPVFRRAARLSQAASVFSALPVSLKAAVIRLVATVGSARPAREKLVDLLCGSTSVQAVAIALRRVLPDATMRPLGFFPTALGLPPDYIDDGGYSETNSLQTDLFNAVSHAEIAHYMRDMLLRDSDANSMHHSLELRVPFLDQPLIDRVLELPGSHKQPTGGLPKQILRKAFATEIGPLVAGRQKTGFTLPIGEWMRGGMREFCEASIGNLCAASDIDRLAAQSIWTRFVDGRDGLHWSRPFTLVVAGAYIDSHRT